MHGTFAMTINKASMTRKDAEYDLGQSNSTHDVPICKTPVNISHYPSKTTLNYLINEDRAHGVAASAEVRDDLTLYWA